MKSRLVALLPLSLLLACPQQDAEEAVEGGPSELEKKALEKGCATWSTMPGEYLRIEGTLPDPKLRFRIIDDGDGTWTMWYIDGGLQRRLMDGVKRESDLAFTEIPDARKKAAYEAGNEALKRLYVEPKMETCALQVKHRDVTLEAGAEKEVMSMATGEFVRFPKGHDLGWQPCDGPLFLNEAATDHAVAKAQLAETGSPKFDHEMGEAIPAAAWSDAAADGDAACTFDMDLYFDHKPVAEGGKNVPAGPVTDGARQWLVPAWRAPWTGNHLFEMQRYRTCGGGQRELIGVSCLEAALN